jgi:hypothetical protein
MSLDVYLKVGDETVFEYNITHNLGRMAGEAGCYEALWRPEEIGVERAGQLAELLKTGLLTLVSDPDRFEAMNPENGWGSYDGLVKFLTAYLKACIQNPDTSVETSR